MLTIFDFPDRWPHEPVDYVFLAGAVQEIGKAIFGDDWTGHEGEGTDETDEDEDFEPPDSEGWVNPLPEIAYPDSAVLDLHVSLKDLTPLEIYRESDFLRFAYVQSEIVKGCQSGKLVSAQRPTAGGDVTYIPAHYWNVERYKHRFVLCQIGTDPFDCEIKGACWIFISLASLQEFKSLLLLPAEAIYRKEGPGRPTAMAYIEAELERRIKLGEVFDTVTREAEYLHQWAKKQRYPESVIPTAKTIENKIRDRHKAWRDHAKPTVQLPDRSKTK